QVAGDRVERVFGQPAVEHIGDEKGDVAQPGVARLARRQRNRLVPDVYACEVAVLADVAREFERGIAGATGYIETLPAALAWQREKRAQHQPPEWLGPLRRDQRVVHLSEARLAHVVADGEVVCR